MASSKIVVHRGNSPANMSSPIDQVGYYVDAGFSIIEIDIYAISATTYKFCHPLDASTVTEVHNLYDGFLNELVKKYPATEWFVDLKCLNLDGVPEDMMQHLVDAFGKSAVYTAAQHEILEFVHRAGMRTCQYFKDGINQKLNFKPDLYTQNASENLQYPKKKTIIYCSTLADASDYLRRGFAGVMVDGQLLIFASNELTHL